MIEHREEISGTACARGPSSPWRCPSPVAAPLGLQGAVAAQRAARLLQPTLCLVGRATGAVLIGCGVCHPGKIPESGIGESSGAPSRESAEWVRRAIGSRAPLPHAGRSRTTGGRPGTSPRGRAGRGRHTRDTRASRSRAAMRSPHAAIRGAPPAASPASPGRAEIPRYPDAPPLEGESRARRRGATRGRSGRSRPRAGRYQASSPT